ncbi:MAG: DUF3298 domain-containing protein [Candidatus Pacebacteria bacterium]|nr:DUF3298 domain-containing protein [Candidatus Paceibacterota bacterium]
MHSHTRWFIYVLLLAFVLFLGIFFHIKINEPSDYVVVPVSIPEHATYYKEVTIDTTEHYASFDIHYPQFTKTNIAFNKEIASIVENARSSFSRDAEDNWKAYREINFESGDPGQYPSDPYRLSITWDKTTIDARYISFIMRISGYNGGAHGFENIVSFNYDIVQQKEITLADLFPNDPDYLKTISEYSRASLKTQLIENGSSMNTGENVGNDFEGSTDPMLLAGTEPTLENFSVFTFTPSEITFYFTQYQVAPYVAGEQQVVMLRK